MQNLETVSIIADSMNNKKELIFLAVVAVSTFIHELGIIYGFAFFLFIPLMLGIIAVGFWTFGKEKPSG